MRLKFSKAFSLLEVVITAGILTTAIVFIFRSFTAVLSGVKLSQNITLACFLAEDKLFEIEQNLKSGAKIQEPKGVEAIQAREFSWDYTTRPEGTHLTELELNLTWQEDATRKEKLNIKTYLVAQ